VRWWAPRMKDASKTPGGGRLLVPECAAEGPVGQVGMQDVRQLSGEQEGHEGCEEEARLQASRTGKIEGAKPSVQKWNIVA
jgi:hypothetical protein